MHVLYLLIFAFNYMLFIFVYWLCVRVMMQQQKHASPDRKPNPSLQRSPSPLCVDSSSWNPVAEAGAGQAAPLQPCFQLYESTAMIPLITVVSSTVRVTRTFALMPFPYMELLLPGAKMTWKFCCQQNMEMSPNSKDRTMERFTAMRTPYIMVYAVITHKHVCLSWDKNFREPLHKAYTHCFG